MQLAEGVVVAGRFKLRRELGRGGMGAVWLADHVSLDVPCAVKFIIGESAEEAESVARFQREARAAAQIKSPHVVQILDYGTWERTPYIAMEYLEGEDLSRRLHRKGRLEPAEVFTVVSQVARALQKAHDLGIVHRDLKPENVFLAKDADGAIAKILDFGIAKRTKKLGDSSTKTGALLGTPFYMSPEQTRGTKAVDHRSDLWSLAVIVYECLTGSLPFQSEAFGDLLVQIMFNEAVLPTTRVANLPPGIDGWWQKAAAKDPDDRFGTARQLVDALGPALGLNDTAALSAVATNVPLPSDHPPAPEGGPATPPPPSSSGPTERSAGLAQGTLSALTPSPTSRTFVGAGQKQGRGVVFALGAGALLVGLGGAAALLWTDRDVTRADSATASSASEEPPPSVSATSSSTPSEPPSPASSAPDVPPAPAPAEMSPAPVPHPVGRVPPVAVPRVAAPPKPPAVQVPVAPVPAAPKPAVPKAPAVPKPPKKDFGI